jgi:hypothetical protein
VQVQEQVKMQNSNEIMLITKDEIYAWHGVLKAVYTKREFKFNIGYKVYRMPMKYKLKDIVLN